jgi:hypothetical protein
MQQLQVCFITEMEGIYCAVRTHSIEVNVMSPLKWASMSQVVCCRPLNDEAWARFKDILSRKCGGTNVEM